MARIIEFNNEVQHLQPVDNSEYTGQFLCILILMPPNTSTPSQEHRAVSFYLVLLLPLIILLFIILALYAWKVKYVPPVKIEKPNQTYLNLKNSQEFQDAQQAMKRKNYPLALSLFQQVGVNGQNEYSFIQYEMANARLNINRQDGVVAFSNLVASSSINTETKGYAVNTLGRTYTSSHDETILSTLKELAPSWGADTALTKNFIQATTSNDAFTGLLEIGGSYYPIMDSEMRLAFLYGKVAKEAKENNNTEAFEEYKNKTIAKLSSANTDQNNTRLSENLSWMLPSSLSRKAMTLGILKNLGIEAEDPAIYFEQALNLSTAQGISVPPFILYNYSTYLIKSVSNNENDEKIILMLRPIVENKNSPDLALFFEFTKNAFKNNEVGNTNDLKALSKIYPPFGEAIK